MTNTTNNVLPTRKQSNIKTITVELFDLLIRNVNDFYSCASMSAPCLHHVCKILHPASVPAKWTSSLHPPLHQHLQSGSILKHVQLK